MVRVRVGVRFAFCILGISWVTVFRNVVRARAGFRVRVRVPVRVRVTGRVRVRREILTCPIRGSNSVAVFVTWRRYQGLGLGLGLGLDI